MVFPAGRRSRIVVKRVRNISCVCHVQGNGIQSNDRAAASRCRINIGPGMENRDAGDDDDDDEAKSETTTPPSDKEAQTRRRDVDRWPPSSSFGEAKRRKLSLSLSLSLSLDHRSSMVNFTCDPVFPWLSPVLGPAHENQQVCRGSREKFSRSEERRGARHGKQVGRLSSRDSLQACCRRRRRHTRTRKYLGNSEFSFQF